MGKVCWQDGAAKRQKGCFPLHIADSRRRSLLIILAVYLAAGAAALMLFRALPYPYWLNLLLADLAGTCLVFLFSVLLGNASVYDPYWSVFPVAAITVCFAQRQLTTLSLAHLIVIWLWGLRLTANWAYTFHGLREQDWRYTMLRERTGKWYPLVNFLGIHLVPTLITYLCVLPAVYAEEHAIIGIPGSYGFVLLSMGATVLQGTADYQMHAFRREHRGELIRTGLWTYSRHPNYLGEILMWWGIGLSVAVAVPDQPWLLAGAAVNTLLFLFVSIPMADQRQSRKPGFPEYKEQTRMLLPVKPRRL